MNHAGRCDSGLVVVVMGKADQAIGVGIVDAAGERPDSKQALRATLGQHQIINRCIALALARRPPLFADDTSGLSGFAKPDLLADHKRLYNVHTLVQTTTRKSPLTKDLIIVRAGRRSLHTSWLDPRVSRNWDLCVCPYEEIPTAPTDENDWISSNVVAGAKFIGIKVLLHQWQGWRDYRFVVLADDDLLATQATWSSFFDRCAQYGARLAQPALAEGSHIGHMLTARNTEFVARRVSFVEVMMPCFRADVLAQLLPTLNLTKTGWGWGVDVLWATQLGFKDLFVIDDTPVLHTRPVHSSYNPELRDQVSAELRAIVQDNGLVWAMKTLSGFLPDGTEITQADKAFLYRLFRGYDYVFRQHPERFAEVIQWQLANLSK